MRKSIKGMKDSVTVCNASIDVYYAAILACNSACKKLAELSTKYYELNGELDSDIERRYKDLNTAVKGLLHL